MTKPMPNGFNREGPGTMDKILTAAQIGLIAIYIEQALVAHPPKSEDHPIPKIPTTITNPPDWLYAAMGKIQADPRLPQCEQFIAREWAIVVEVARYFAPHLI